jgi:hypothetical protein
LLDGGDAESTLSRILSTIPLYIKNNLQTESTPNFTFNAWVRITKCCKLSTEYLFRGQNVCSATLSALAFIYAAEILHKLLNLNFERSTCPLFMQTELRTLLNSSSYYS